MVMLHMCLETEIKIVDMLRECLDYRQPCILLGHVCQGDADGDSLSSLFAAQLPQAVSEACECGYRKLRFGWWGVDMVKTS